MDEFLPRHAASTSWACDMMDLPAPNLVAARSDASVHFDEADMHLIELHKVRMDLEVMMQSLQAEMDAAESEGM